MAHVSALEEFFDEWDAIEEGFETRKRNKKGSWGLKRYWSKGITLESIFSMNLKKRDVKLAQKPLKTYWAIVNQLVYKQEANKYSRKVEKPTSLKVSICSACSMMLLIPNRVCLFCSQDAQNDQPLISIQSINDSPYFCGRFSKYSRQ